MMLGAYLSQKHITKITMFPNLLSHNLMSLLHFGVTVCPPLLRPPLDEKLCPVDCRVNFKGPSGTFFPHIFGKKSFFNK